MGSLLHVQNAYNINIHDIDIVIEPACTSNTVGICVHNAFNVSIRNFILENGGSGANTGIRFISQDEATAGKYTVLNNIMLDTGIVRRFDDQILIDLKEGGSGNSWTFRNTAFIGDNTHSAKNAIRIKSGMVNNINIINCKSEYHENVFHLQAGGSRNSNDHKGDINIAGLHAANPNVVWRFEPPTNESHVLSYWIGAVRCLYSAGGSYGVAVNDDVVLVTDTATYNARLLSGKFLISKPPGATVDEDFKKSCIPATKCDVAVCTN